MSSGTSPLIGRWIEQEGWRMENVNDCFWKTFLENKTVMLKKTYSFSFFFLASGSESYVTFYRLIPLIFFPPSDLATNLAGEGQRLFLGWLQSGLALWMCKDCAKTQTGPTRLDTLHHCLEILNKILNKGLHIHFALGSTKYVARLRFQSVCSRKSEQWAWGSSVAPPACTWRAEGSDVCMPTEERRATEASWGEWRLGLERRSSQCVWDSRLEPGTMDSTHGSQNVTLAWPDGTGPHNSMVTGQRPDQRAKGKGHPRSNGRTWIPHHLLPHDLEDHVSQEQDL